MAKGGSALALGGLAVLAYLALRRNPETGQAPIDTLLGGGGGGSEAAGQGYDPYAYTDAGQYGYGGGSSNLDTPALPGETPGDGGGSGATPGSPGPSPLLPGAENFFNANLGTILGVSAVTGATAGLAGTASKFRGAAKPPPVPEAPRTPPKRPPASTPPPASRISRWGSAVAKGGKVLGPVGIAFDSVVQSYDLTNQARATQGVPKNIQQTVTQGASVVSGTVANVGGFFTGTKVGYNQDGGARVEQGIPIVSGLLDIFGIDSRARVV